MAKLPSSFDWKVSAQHLDLLEKFKSPRDVNQVLDWQYLKETLKESPKDAIQRFIGDGFLVPATLGEAVDRMLTQANIKKLLKDIGEKQSGSKEELVQRLIAANQAMAEKAVTRTKVMKCSEGGIALLEEFEKRKQIALENAQQQAFLSLASSNAKDAYRTFLAYQREHVDVNSESQSYIVEEIQSILAYTPDALKHLPENGLQTLRAAVSMDTLWDGESAEKWISDDELGFPVKVAASYLARGAEIFADANRDSKYVEGFELEFDDGDVDSCDLWH